MNISCLLTLRIALFGLLTFVSTLVSAQYKLTINGTAPMLKDGEEIRLTQFVPFRLRSANKPYITKVKDHSFKFTLNVDGAEGYYLGTGKHGYRMFIEPGNVNIIIADSTLSNVSLTGSLANIDNNKYYTDIETSSLNSEYSQVQDDYYHYQSIKNFDTTLAKVKWRKMDSVRLLIQKLNLKLCFSWIKQHPNSLINTNILYDQLLYTTPYITEDELKKVYNSMPAATTGNVWGKELHYRIDNLFIGAAAPDFSLPDTSGRQKSLKDFRGKYVLIDFWASWCVPCRKENPGLVKAIKKFGDRNFTLLGISMDDERIAWTKAIKQDELNWVQVSGLYGQQNPVAIQYYANTYPYNYLISPDGKIIAKNLRGDELNMMLSKLLK